MWLFSFRGLRFLPPPEAVPHIADNANIWIRPWFTMQRICIYCTVTTYLSFYEDRHLTQVLSMGSVMSSPSGVRGRVPAENGFWCILKAAGRFFCIKMTKSEGTICISVPLPKFWGDLSPLSPPWSTPMRVGSGERQASNDNVDGLQSWDTVYIRISRWKTSW